MLQLLVKRDTSRHLDVQALAGSHLLSLLQNVPGETFPAVPSLVDQSMIKILGLCVVETAIVVLLRLSIIEKNMQSVGSNVEHLEAF